MGSVVSIGEASKVRQNLRLARQYEQLAQLVEQATQLYDLGQYEQALGVAEHLHALACQFLELEHPDREDYIHSLANVASSLEILAALYHVTGDHVKAISSYRQALEINREALGKESAEVAQGLENLARVHFTIGSYARARSLLEQALHLRRDVLGEGELDLCLASQNLAVVHIEMGDYAAAKRLLQQALEIDYESLEEEPMNALAALLNDLAAVYIHVGSYAAAEKVLQKALGITRRALGQENIHYTTRLHNLAVLHFYTGDYDKAKELLAQAREIEHAMSADDAHVAVSSNTMAFIYLAMGDYGKAKLLFEEALEINCSALTKDHPDVALSLHNLALFHQLMGDNDRAEAGYRQAIQICRRADKSAHIVVHPNFATFLNSLAQVCTATGRVAEAMKLMVEAATIHDRSIGQVFSIGSESQRMAYLGTLRTDHDAFLSLLVRRLSHPSRGVRVGLDLVLRRKGIGAEALAAQRDAALGGRYPRLRSKLEELIALRAQIARKTLDGPGAEGLKAHRQSLTEWEERREVLEADLAREIPEMNLAQRLRAADRVAVAGALPEGSALVEFVRFNVFDFKAVPARGEKRWKPARYVAFVLPAREPDSVQMVDLGEAEAVDEMIATFRASIIGEGEGRAAWRPVPTPVDTRASEGRLLRERVFDPLLAALDGRKRLFLAPDGDLSLLPFEVLPSGDGACLIDEYVISYVSTGRDVLRFGAPSTGHPSEPLVAAGPAFSLASGGEGARAAEAVGRQSRDMEQIKPFEPLEHASLEGERIARTLKVKPLLGKDVLEGRIKRCRSPRVLHIATHGFFLPDQERDLERARLGSETMGEGMGRLVGARLENPLLRSGLALAGANDWLEGKPLPEEAEDGILTAVDVTGLDLLATDLVVLSACKTGEGEVRIGEGVFGLRRAFVLAGAKTLVMSLWKVPDAETRQLMEAFYRNILDDQPRADALRAAQREIKARHPEPYYWGAFICQGDPGSLLRSRSVNKHP